MVNELNRVVVFHEVMKDGITYNGGSPRIFYCYICNYGDIFTNDKGQPMKFYKEHLSHPSDIIKTYKITIYEDLMNILFQMFIINDYKSMHERVAHCQSTEYILSEVFK